MWWYILGGTCAFGGLVFLYRMYKDKGEFFSDILSFILNILSLTIEIGSKFIGGGGSSSGGGSSDDY